MSGILDKNNKYSKDRLLTAICLIMIIEHKELGLDDMIKATGMEFAEIRKSMQNLVNIRLVNVLPTQSGIPKFVLIDENEAKEYLTVIGVKT